MQKLKDLLLEIRAQALPRFLLGIAGPPGSGKSTLAELTCRIWNEEINTTTCGAASIVPMDGYHHSNEELLQMGLLHLKGIPATFDSQSFIKKLKEIQSQPHKTHYCPRFDRSIEASVADDISVTPEHKVVIVEGNYLLLDEAPWDELSTIFNSIWYIDASESVLLPRLLSRHQAAGKDSAKAREKVESTDLPNARLVEKTKTRADKILTAEELMLR
jgi:pantothenate kinase